MKALPIAKLVSPHARPGEVLLLVFARSTLTTRTLYPRLVDLKRHYRGLQGDGVRAFFVEQQIRRIWSRLVDRSSGYWETGATWRSVWRSYDA